MVPFQVAVAKQSLPERAKGPDTVTLLTDTPVVPVSDTHTLVVALVVPTVTEPKETLAGDRETDAGAITVTAAEVVMFPAASRATAVSVCVPLALPRVFQATV